MSSSSSSSPAALQNILTTLEKRFKEGPGSLSLAEVKELETDSDRILEELKNQEAERVADLRAAVSQLDATKVSALLDSGLVQMDEATTNAAFWEVVKAVDRAEKEDKPLPADVPKMLHHIFDADLQHLLRREKLTTNVTCMQPVVDEGIDGKARRMNYIFDDASHKDLPLEEGRRCEDGSCCDACSRNIFPTFATDKEIDFSKFPEFASFTFNNIRRVSTATIIQFTRLVERVRRTMAHEYGLPLSSLLPLQAYSRKYVAGTTQQGGGGGEGDFVTLHTDEATHAGYHYSCVLYLNSQGEDFEGGDFVFNDPAETSETEVADKDDDDEDPIMSLADLEEEDEDDELGMSLLAEDIEEEDEDEEQAGMSLAEEIRRAGRKLTPFHPSRGSAVIFSSGWENMHEVEKITSGTRYTVPCFFTTCPVPEAAYEPPNMVVGKPKTDDDIADDWLHLLLAHRRETPLESTARVKELLMKWHYMCTPLSEHN